MPDIVCFVDSLRNKRRFVYWEPMLKKLGMALSLRAIPDLVALARSPSESEKAEVPKLHEFDVVIINYDVANGGFEYGSDQTATYFRNRGGRSYIPTR